MLLSVHIPKTAGVSFRKVLAEIYGAGFVQYYWQITDAHGRVCPDIPVGTTCIHGHFQSQVLADRFPEASLVTWVRDPVDRVASSYYYRLRSPDWQHPVCVELHEKKLSLVEFAGLELVRDEMSRFMGNRRPADFAFIGIVEKIDASMAQFYRRFGHPYVPLPRENANPERSSSSYEISPAEREQILELNRSDAALYQACLKRHHEDIGADRA